MLRRPLKEVKVETAVMPTMVGTEFSGIAKFPDGYIKDHGVIKLDDRVEW